jgi:hypothetical protein
LQSSTRCWSDALSDSRSFRVWAVAVADASALATTHGSNARSRGMAVRIGSLRGQGTAADHGAGAAVPALRFLRRALDVPAAAGYSLV